MWWTMWGALASQDLTLTCPVTEGPRTFQMHRMDGRSVDFLAARIELTVAGGVAMGRSTTREPARDQVWGWRIPEGPVLVVLGEQIARSILEEPPQPVLASDELPPGLHELARAQGLGCGPVPTTPRDRAVTVANPWGGAPLAATESVFGKREGREILVIQSVSVAAEVWGPAIPREADLEEPPPHRGDVSWVEGVRHLLIATFDASSGELIGVQSSREVHGGRVHDEGSVTLRFVPSNE